MRMTDAGIDKMFTYHPPFGTQGARYALIRQKAREFAKMLNANCPDSREKSLAITRLQECVQMANASIAINESVVECMEFVEPEPEPAPV